MPMGISRFGFLASWAAVETASKPMYAKKITPAARTTPDHPYFPNSPWLGGRKGVQLATAWLVCLRIYAVPRAIKINSTQTLITTIREFAFADSLMPITRIAVTAAIPRNATRLKTPVWCGRVEGSILLAARVLEIRPNASQRPLYITNGAPGVPANHGGMWI